MNQNDCLRRFLFDDLGVRGEWVHLQTSFQAAKHYQSLSDHVASQLGEALAAVTLLSATIKFKGSMVLQAQGNGALHTLVAQASDQQEIRGLVRGDKKMAEGSLQTMMGEGRLVLTTKAENGEPYQGIVSLEANGLAEVIENYFQQSEQLPTRVWLFSDKTQVAGLFLQKIPTEGREELDWERITAVANTITADELLNLDCETVLYRLFNEDKLRLFEPQTVTFKCSCSREKIIETLQTLGRDDLESALKEQEIVAVDCEFCGQKYTFNAEAIEMILTPNS
ncbi:MAG: Hsp33 family molecular chaperone HslO [Methylococcales bacterium]|nr:Hsp33 family molecular chaperone HslO [Methylococcales bacterium]